MLKEVPFPIERIQSDRGSEFISGEFIQALRRHKVQLRPNRPRAPHLNGKVERSQQTDLMEFYALEITVKGKHRRAKEPGQLAERLAEWQRFYNEERPHSGLGGKAPQQRWSEVAALTPTRAELDAQYDLKQEPESVKRGNWVWVAAPSRKDVSDLHISYSLDQITRGRSYAEPRANKIFTAC